MDWNFTVEEKRRLWLWGFWISVVVIACIVMGTQHQSDTTPVPSSPPSLDSFCSGYARNYYQDNGVPQDGFSPYQDCMSNGQTLQPILKNLHS
jgi:hypothetical protein